MTAQDRHEEAETPLLESRTALNKTLGANDPRTQRAKTRLVNLYEAWGKPDEVARYRNSLSPSK